MSKFLALAGAAMVALAAAPSLAGTYVLTYTSNGGAPLGANMTVITSDDLNAVGGYDVLGISGDVDGEAITGLVSNPNQPNTTRSTDGLFDYDNVLFPNSPQVSGPGLLFTTATLEYNLFSDDATTFELYSANADGYSNHSTGTLDVQAVPEPASWAMFIGGFGLVGAAMRRRRRTVRFA